MRLGAVTYNVLKDWDLETVIKNLEAAQFEAVELRTGHKHGVEVTASKEERARIQKRFQASKVRLLSFGTACEFQSPDPKVRQENVDLGKKWVDLAHDTGAWGIKVRPNGFPPNSAQNAGSRGRTIETIGESLRELGKYAAGMGVEVWMEVHGKDTQDPPVSAAIMKATKHDNVGLCWNSNPTDLVDGSVKPSFDMLRPWIRNCHINELAGPYPYREFFKLLREAKYERYTLCEAAESKEPERFLRWYRALWMELNRA